MSITQANVYNDDITIFELKAIQNISSLNMTQYTIYNGITDYDLMVPEILYNSKCES